MIQFFQSVEAFTKFLVYSNWAIIGILIFVLAVMVGSFSSVKEQIKLIQIQLDHAEEENRQLNDDIKSLNNLVWGLNKNGKHME